MLFDASKGDLNDLVKFADVKIADKTHAGRVEDTVFDRVPPGGSHEIHLPDPGSATKSSSTHSVASRNGRESHS